MAQQPPRRPGGTARDGVERLPAGTTPDTLALQPGDIQLVHSHVALYARNDYEDWPEPERKRHLLRLWIAQESFSAGDEALRQGVQAVR